MGASGRGLARGLIAVLVLLLIVAGVVAQASVIYVDKTAAGANSGTSWADAYTDLQAALNAATSGDQILVAAGVYYPGTTQASSFALKNGVGLYGGYSNGGGTRDVASNITVLSGDIDHNDTTDINGVVTSIAGSNAYHVVTSNGNDNTAVLDGFTITGGNPTASSYPDSDGGGMLNVSSSSPAVTNCTFSGNSAANDGGGMYNRSSSPTVTNCTFSDNSAAYGGGMCNYDSSSPHITNCTFSGNSADSGAGMENFISSPTVSDCTFSNNSADRYGGGIDNYNQSSPTVTGCTFNDNSAGSLGGGMYNTQSSPDVTNCTFSGNSAGNGGGVGSFKLSSTSSSPQLTNCTFSGNSATYDGGGIYNNSCSPTIRNTILWGNTASINGDEIYNNGSTPVVEYCVVQDGYAGGTNIITNDPHLGPLGDYGGSTETIPLLSGSSAIDTASAAYAPSTDQRGISRPQGSADDIGAYEVVVLSPVMVVQGNGNTIPNGDTTPSTADGTDFGSADINTGTVDHTFTIKNTGTADLELTETPKVQVSGTNAGDFTVTVQPASPIASGGGTTTFTVRFDPGAAGTRSAKISIANNSADNPYTFAIQGTGAVPEMDVLGRGISIADGDSSPSATDDTDFGSTPIAGGTVDHTFTIKNTGTADLNLTDTPKVRVSGTDAGDFTVTVQPASPVASGGGTTTFTVRFDPNATGTRSATISIANNDVDENPYNFAIQGTGTVAASPEMDVQGGSPVVSIMDGNTTPSTADGTDFGTTLVTGGTVDHTFTIKNTGTGNLSLTDTPKVQVAGTNAADFTVTVQPASPVADGGGTTTFTVCFAPSAAGTRSATISIANDDADENPYNFAIRGTGVNKGDVNGDGAVNILDARLCLQIARGVIEGTPEQRQQADMNGDGEVTLTDAQLLADFVIGISH